MKNWTGAFDGRHKLKLMLNKNNQSWNRGANDRYSDDEEQPAPPSPDGQIDGLLLGDSGYPCRKYLMTPYAKPRNQSEKRHL
ncbi:hypothetical protein MAR_037840 [Mya arenaria]|uniref:DDE Tnp4 domain-containing protein n=1 Tax=Mya arenaria TaxID=6604 RepID=A0ABY7FTX0_MYAAR|nr:hypothetical protein MAR_037840 [Mya arenaria]